MAADGTRKVEVAEKLMTRPQGATMDEILKETGGSYQYGAKRRLEARGYTVRTRKEGRVKRYFADPPPAPSFDATLTSKGQLTLPKELRRRLGVREGSKLRFTIEPGDRVVMSPAAQSIQRLFGALGRPPRSATLEEMDEAVRDAVVERYRRAGRDR
jgi:antitoxin PrlF